VACKEDMDLRKPICLYATGNVAVPGNHQERSCSSESKKKFYHSKGSAWYQEESWDQAPGRLFSRDLAVQGAKDTP